MGTNKRWSRKFARSRRQTTFRHASGFRSRAFAPNFLTWSLLPLPLRPCHPTPLRPLSPPNYGHGPIQATCGLCFLCECVCEMRKQKWKIIPNSIANEIEGERRHKYTYTHTQRAFKPTPKEPKTESAPQKAITDALHNFDALKAK